MLSKLRFQIITSTAGYAVPEEGVPARGRRHRFLLSNYLEFCDAGVGCGVSQKVECHFDELQSTGDIDLDRDCTSKMLLRGTQNKPKQ